MATPESNKPDSSDEIDLGQLFNLIGKGFQKVFRAFLRVYLYFKRNIFWILGLAILGGVTGLLINRIGEQEYQQDVIVTPGLFSKNYLYDVVSELQANLEAHDTVFFNSIGIDLSKTPKLKIEIASLREPAGEDSENEIEFIKLLGETVDSEIIRPLLEEELLVKATMDHRITFSYKNREYGMEWVQKIIEHINSNAYYGELLKIETKNARDRILQNDSLVGQIDRLINEYTEKLKSDNTGAEGRLVLENQESLDIPALMVFKNKLITNTENKKLEL
ncbi:hypothetical protein, partial [Robiginitalea sp.]|uniref:hypothetical protein n=1 Tax=Robiginitalea sp. TaxID=1902411 RepID=UPI003C7587C9